MLDLTRPSDWLAFSAVAVSSVTGVLQAEAKRIDLFGVILIALAAGLGGGTVRDVLIGRQVFWIADQRYLFVAICAAAVTVLAARWRPVPRRLFLLPDALGLALFAVVGTGIALDHGVPWFAATFMGVITGVFGGVLSDVLRNEVPLVFGGTLYATAAWAGALLYVWLQGQGLAATVAALWAAALILALRLAALRYKLTLPGFGGGPR
jgi:uncharacterized membrane protein YeiH